MISNLRAPRATSEATRPVTPRVASRHYQQLFLSLPSIPEEWSQHLAISSMGSKIRDESLTTISRTSDNNRQLHRIPPTMRTSETSLSAAKSSVRSAVRHLTMQDMLKYRNSALAKQAQMKLAKHSSTVESKVCGLRRVSLHTANLW